MAKKKLKETMKENNEKSARRTLIEELFQDFHTSRKQVYQMNFIRGIFFGLGSVLGGTIIVALAITLLNLLTDIPGGLGDFVQYIVDLVREEN